ncbi:MAG: amidase [Janthinobacterium lividum]
MSFASYADHDAVELATLIRTRQVAASEVTDAAIDRLEQLNPAINAIAYRAFDEARTAAKVVDTGAFAGVPMLIKDLGLRVAGWPLTSGSRFHPGKVDTADDGLVRRYRQSGAILLGRSTSSEFGIVGNVETAAYGATRNPWNLDHIAGGSSGGSAAAVAAGIVPIAHASDGLGSIRIPAACCGLVGMKPTRDRVPNLPDFVDYALGFVCDHVVTRSVRDSAAMLDATGVPERASPYAIPPKVGPYLDEVAQAPGSLRIRWSSEAFRLTPIDHEVTGAVEDIAAKLAALGHSVEARGLGAITGAILKTRLAVSAGNFAAAMARTIVEVGREPTLADVEPLTLGALMMSRQVDGATVFQALQQLRWLSRAMLEQFEDFDVYMSPVMATPPPAIGTISPATMDPLEINRLQTLLYPFTPVFNVTGQPSISLPLAHSEFGLPIGIMFTARYGDEATLFRLAGQLEKELPWATRRPPMWTS